MNTNKLGLLYGSLPLPPFPTSLEESCPQLTQGKEMPSYISRSEVTPYQFLTFGSEPKPRLLPIFVLALDMSSFEKH